MGSNPTPSASDDDPNRCRSGRRPSGPDGRSRRSSRRRAPRYVAWTTSGDAAALEQAGSPSGDVPIGAVVVVDGAVVAARHNERELTGDPTAHAEVLALRDAAAARRSLAPRRRHRWSSPSSRARCAPARWSNARVGRLVFGAAEPRRRRRRLALQPRRRPPPEPRGRVTPASGPTSAPRCSTASSPTALTLDRPWRARRQSAPTTLGRRRVARADEWGGLESRCGLRVTVGSNPTLSASLAWHRPAASTARTMAASGRPSSSAPGTTPARRPITR